MTPHQPQRIRALIDRLAKLSEGEDWAADLNPAQMTALNYLSRANRFSRAPSHVSAYSGSTRGTVSQTLRALERKGLVSERKSETDRRSISFELTDAGEALASAEKEIDRVIADLPEETSAALEAGLENLLRQLLGLRGGKAFGLCRTCRHHRRKEDGGYCELLSVDLKPAETTQICHEHEPAQ
ncbi:MAG: MarR family transcriptional regulator [Hoeflea sp.]|uniref:MarR family winged helix-turn-helix transcriptional regulator n=1 Tax=Hoeflea sp. TaxID=1940281 RepID=UPI0032EB64C1